MASFRQLTSHSRLVTSKVCLPLDLGMSYALRCLLTFVALVRSLGPCSPGALLALAQVEPVLVAPGAVLLLLHHLLFPAVPSMAPGGRFTFNILLSPTAGSSQVCCLSAGVSAVPSVQERGLCDASGLCTLSPRRLQAVLLRRAGYLPGVFSEK